MMGIIKKIRSWSDSNLIVKDVLSNLFFLPSKVWIVISILIFVLLIVRFIKN
jgi:hypothetical protein